MRSIKHKIWLAILAVTALVILCLWFFQVILLERFYMEGKKNEILEDTQYIAEMINQNGGYDVLDDLNDFAYKNNYRIELTDTSGFLISGRGIGVVGENSILRNDSYIRLQIISNLYNSGQEYYLQDNIYSKYGDRFYVGATHQRKNGLQYILLVESALAPVTEAVETIKGQLVYISIALILLATGAAFLLARSLTRPILKISKAAQRVAAGDLNVEVYVKSKDEIGRLSNDFNMMMREINKANTLQRELVANVSHDIRTPLTMIKGYAETIRDLTGENRVKREEQLDIIIEESNRLNVLVNDILDLSRLQAGQLAIELREFDLAVKLRDIMKRYDLLETNENFVFSLEAPEHLMVYADEVKMEQVIYNIINNATNHTGSDKKIMVRLKEQAEIALVEVQDTGAGIKQEDMPLIWDRYYKPYKKNDRKGMGTGLGLSIVKAILTAHHFRFGVNSRLGKGSVFWFEVQKTIRQEVLELPDPMREASKGKIK